MALPRAPFSPRYSTRFPVPFHLEAPTFHYYPSVAQGRTMSWRLEECWWEVRRKKVLAELRQADLITSEECELRNINGVIGVQCVKSPEVVTETADVLRRHGFESESKLLPVLAELRQADLITSDECEKLRNINDVIRVQCVKSLEVVTKTADVLRRYGFDSESELLAVVAELQQADLLTGKEFCWLQDISDVVRVQCSKSPEVMARTADVLYRHGFGKEGDIVLLVRGLQLMFSTEVLPKEFEDLTCLAFSNHTSWVEEFMESLSNLPPNRLELMLEILGVSSDDILSSCPVSFPCGGPSPSLKEVVTRVIRRHGKRAIADICAKHLMDEKCYLAAEANLHRLVDVELPQLISEYATLKEFTDTILSHLPKAQRRQLRQARKAVSSSVRRVCGECMASKVLDTRELRQQIHALHDPELLKQLSSYEENSLKPFVVTFLERCKENGVQPDYSQPDVPLSPSTPADQLLGFILSRKDYYITDLHINREHFSPWDVDTPPPAPVPPTLDGLSRRLDTLLTSYSTLFTKVVENVETLPQRQYHNLRSYFNGLPHTEVHLPSSQDEVCDHLHRTPLFAPLCTALLRKVVKFLFTDDADNLSHQLRDYEKKLSTFVRQFLLACHRKGVVPSTGGVCRDEDGCDLNNPSHLLACVLALKSYYMVSLRVDESLFTSLQREVDLEGEGREENVSMDSSPLSPTPPTSESESPGSSIPLQSKGKGKHRVGTSPGHMTSHMTIAEIMKICQDDFLKDMKAEALCRKLALKGVIPEEVKTDITRARSTGEANLILYSHLQEQCTEANLRQLCEVASMEKGYGKMNELAGRILEEL